MTFDEWWPTYLASGGTEHFNILANEESSRAAWDAASADEGERYAALMQAVEWLLNDGHMNQEHLARLRAAWEQAQLSTTQHQ